MSCRRHSRPLFSVLNLITYHEIFDYSERLISLHHLDIELSQVVVVDCWLNVGERDEIGHPKVWRRQSLREWNVAIMQGEITVASGLGALWILSEEQQREKDALDDIYDWFVRAHLYCLAFWQLIILWVLQNWLELKQFAGWSKWSALSFLSWKLTDSRAHFTPFKYTHFCSAEATIRSISIVGKTQSANLWDLYTALSSHPCILHH